jgi:AcrR family transcriptional regulator
VWKIAELTRRRIIEQARTLFIEQGYEKVSMRGIAKDLGCSHGALYYHFKNKTTLFSEVLAFYFDELNLLIDLTVKQAENDKLQELFLAFLRFGLNYPHQYELMFLLKSEEMDSLMQQSATASYEKFAAAVREASGKELQNEAIYSIFLALHGFVSLHLHRIPSFEGVAKSAAVHVDFLRETI